MKAKEIILLVFIIAAGVFFYHVQAGKIDVVWDDFIAWDFNEYAYQETEVIDPPLPASLHVLNSHGQVEVLGTETDRITFTFEKKIWRRNEEKAREVADKLHPIVTKGDTAVTISTNRSDFKRRNFDTNFRITVPSGMAVEVTNSYGPVKADQVGETMIDNRHGEVSATNIRGGAVIENSYEDVEVSSLQSNCTIRSRHSDISVKEVAGEVNIEDSYGLVDFRGGSQKVTITAPHTEIRVEDLSGPLEVRNSYEKITLRNVGPSRIEGSHSPVDADGVAGNLEIDDTYEPIILNSIRGNLQITGGHMSVKGKGIVGDTIYVSSSYEDVDLADFAGKTTILLSHGNITLTPLPLTGPLEVRATYSPIVFFWPGEDRYPLEAQTKSSDIHWSLFGNVSTEEKDNLTLVRAFSEVSDKPRILLSTTYGDIQFEKGPPR
jgi:hypothetical protein